MSGGATSAPGAGAEPDERGAERPDANPAPFDWTDGRHPLQGPERPSDTAPAARPPRRVAGAVERRLQRRAPLRDRVGIFRRARAVIGLAVLTVALGVLLGGAIGASVLAIGFAIQRAFR